MSRPARALVNVSALQHNFQIVRQHAPKSKIMAVIKANAYGHGAIEVARALADADAFAVASIDEARELREAGINQPICLLSGFFGEEDLVQSAKLRLDPIIHYAEQVEQLKKFKADAPINTWIKIDTGMCRLGFEPDEFDDVLRTLQGSDAVAEIKVMSHFANADNTGDSKTQEQIDTFVQATSGCTAPFSLANSAGVLVWPTSHLDWVRPGIMLYGSSPVTKKNIEDFDLHSVMTLETELMAVYQRRKGQAIGYGGDWVCPSDMTIGVAAIGYGDGYPRHAPTGTPVLVNNQRAKLVGRVSMDMITIDLSEQKEARSGDPVVLWGEGLPADEIAQLSGTISYELFCKVTARVPRTFVENPI